MVGSREPTTYLMEMLKKKILRNPSNTSTAIYNQK